MRMMLLIAGIPLLASSATAQSRQTPEQRAEAERRFQTELRMPRPVDALNSVWIEELTWIEVRDAIAAAKRPSSSPLAASSRTVRTSPPASTTSFYAVNVSRWRAG